MSSVASVLERVNLMVISTRADFSDLHKCLRGLKRRMTFLSDIYMTYYKQWKVPIF